ncbi:receptor-type tyrosine-protein phosphatase eta-like [Liolophura sinensis]|uniref:receptor-type tyrosine-protein phosphatase eta-like n=1 Tax=Liolophura sinensis TaxID=3198878 RepID=UPI0031582259
MHEKKLRTTKLLYINRYFYLAETKSEQQSTRRKKETKTSVTASPATPSGVQILSITTNSVEVKVTLSAGRYDGLRVQLYRGQGSTPVSSWIKNVTAETVNNGDQKTITVSGLSPSLTPGVQYTVRVSTRSRTMFSGLSNRSNLKTLAPATPSGVQILSITTSSVTVKVTLSAGKYNGLRVRMYRGSTQVSSWIKDVTAERVNNGTIRTITVSNLSPALTPGAEYTVRVSTRSGSKFSGLSDWSNLKTVAPSKPTLISVEEAPSGGIQVKWQSGGGLLNKYILTVKPSGGTEFTEEKTVSGNPPGQQNVQVSRASDKGQTYTVTVTAKSNGVPSLSSEAKSVTLAPATPSGVQILSITTSSVTVKVTLSAGKYNGLRVRLYRGSTQVSSWIKDVTAERVNNGTIRTITVSNLSPALTPGAEYTVKVSTRSGSKFSGLSDWSNLKTVGENIWFI